MIRALRLLQVEETEETAPFFTPPASDAEGNPSLLRERAFSFMMDMDKHFEVIQERYREKIQLTEKHLRDALAEAERLAASLSA